MTKHIANILTGCRIFGSILLLFFPAFSLGFYIIYLLCGFSDKVHRHSCMLHCNTFCNSRGGMLLQIVNLSNLILILSNT